uniref:Uncharacterized protein n=1 Tax=Odontella aurita TaxID=265563 RepID=A0A7S4MXE3_9STRA|mmetsp:Transcript_38157/g.114079  ORF Transcript_38157/g.114079 Transcript_38157/m.114079 type:complete len:149 (+) Transcript_38157:104-550(+)
MAPHLPASELLSKKYLIEYGTLSCPPRQTECMMHIWRKPYRTTVAQSCRRFRFPCHRISEKYEDEYAASAWWPFNGSDAASQDVEVQQVLQRYAMTVLFFATGGVEGAAGTWTSSLGFLSLVHECKWHQDVLETGVVLSKAKGHVFEE